MEWQPVLYGRATLEINLKELTPKDSFELLKGKIDKSEVLRYLLIMGGIPKYLEEIQTNKSLSQNINQLFFRPNSLFVNEFKRIFYSQFKEYQRYQKIAQLLIEKSMGLKEIGDKIQASSGGGLKTYLENMESAGFITSYIPFDRPADSKIKKYKLVDPYLVFYFKYILPNKKSITDDVSPNIFRASIEPKWKPWLGIAFENFCLKHKGIIAEKMGFHDYVINAGPYFMKSDIKFQIDLIYKRTDSTITLCEIKYHDKPVNSVIIPEVERKCSLIKIPRGYTLEKAFIGPNGVDKSIQKSDYFDHIVTINDLF